MRSRLVLLATLLLAASAQAQESTSRDALRGVYAHFVAPCCWTESLDEHDSPLATSLREEIGSRMAAGETVGQVEEAMVGRYGTRVLTSPPGFAWLAWTLLALLALSGALLVQRHRRRAKAAPALAAEAPTRDALDVRIDDALRELEDA